MIRILTLSQLNLGHLSGPVFALFKTVACLTFLRNPPLPNRGELIMDSLDLVLDMLRKDL